MRSLLRVLAALALFFPRPAMARPASDAGVGICGLPKRPPIVAMHATAGVLVLGRGLPTLAEEELSVGFRVGNNAEVGFACAHLSRFDEWPGGVRILPLSLHLFTSRPRYDIGATFRLGTTWLIAPFTAGAQLDARVWLLDNLGFFGATELCLFSQSGTAAIAPAFRIGLAARL